MNVNRVTLSAFGTSGVLLAASLTMLAMVSALVTFDAWPTRHRDGATSDISVGQAPTPKLVRAVRPGSAARAAARRAAAASGGGTASGGTIGSGGAGGPAGVPAPGTAAPNPYVPSTPPGEGDNRDPTITRNTRHEDSPSLVHTVACGAGATVSSVSGAAGSTVGSACKPLPSTETAGGPSGGSGAG